MKKFVRFLTALICILCCASCSHKNYTFLDMVPADTDFAAVVSLGEVASKAGVVIAKDNTLQFPQSFTESLDVPTLKDIEDINRFLSGSGTDLDSLAVYLLCYQDKPVYVLKLKDKDRFVKRLGEIGYDFIRGQFGIKIYASDLGNGPVVAIRDNIAVLENLEYGQIDDMWRCFYKPDGNPMSRKRGPGSFIQGDPNMAENLPDDVRKILTSPQLESQDVLLLFKTVMGIR